MSDLVFPGAFLVFGALFVPFIPAKLRPPLALALCAGSLWHLWQLPLGTSVHFDGMGLPLELVRVDRLSRVFGIVFHIAAIFSVVFMWHVKRASEFVAALVYAGTAIGATFAGDLICLFVFWELTAISSVFIVWARGTPRAYRTGMRYLIIQVTSGVLLLAGTIVHYANTGALAFEHLSLADAGSSMIFLAFGIKAAFPLLHMWLQDAYPEATVTGSVVLSAFTTKLAIYALARSFAGESILIPIGATMTAFPIFYAVIENDLRRVLAYSLNNQLGFMIVGIGIGTELSLNGTAAHAFAHIIYKGLLFMAMGAVLYRTGTIKASELGGLYKSMPWTTLLCIVGSLSISAFPLFSGFVTKSMVLSAAGEAHLTLTSLVLLFASAGVMDHSGIKIPFFAFFAHDSGKRVKEAPLHMLVAMGIAAFLCVAIGVFPAPLYAILPFPVDYAAYTPTHVVTTLQLLMFSALAFGVLMRSGFYPPEVRSVNLSVDWLYRKGAFLLGGPLLAAGTRLRTQASARLSVAAARVARSLGSWYRPPDGQLGEPWTSGTTALWTMTLLVLCLVFFYL